MPVRQDHRSGLASRLRLSGVLILVSGWVLLSIRLPDPPQYVVSLCFQFLTYKEGFDFGLPVSGRFYPQSSSLLLLVLYYLFFTTCRGVAYVRRIEGGGGGVYSKNRRKWGWRMFVDNSPESPAPVDKPQGDNRLGHPRSAFQRRGDRRCPRVAGIVRGDPCGGNRESSDLAGLDRAGR